MVVRNSWKLQSVDKKLTLKESELYIWRTTVSANIDNLDDYWYLLSQDEQVRAKEFYFVRDKNRYVIARAILRKLIASYIGILPQNILFSYTEYGKPYLAIDNYAQGLKFNLAHSEDCIVYAFTKNIDVGIDTEFFNKGVNIEDIAEYCCSEQEQLQLQKLSNHKKYCYFYKLWALKESIVKAIGLGLTYDFRRIHINFSENKLIDSINIINNDKIDWTVDIFLSYNGYYSAFAVRYPVNRVLFLTYQ